MREATSLVLSARLQADGAHVRAYDPVAEDEARRTDPASASPDGALDAVGTRTPSCWSPSGTSSGRSTGPPSPRRWAGTLVVDGRNALDAEAVRAAGLVYEGIGR